MDWASDASCLGCWWPGVVLAASCPYNAIPTDFALEDKLAMALQRGEVWGGVRHCTFSSAEVFNPQYGNMAGLISKALIRIAQ